MDAPIGGLPVDLGDQYAVVGMAMAEGGQRVEDSEEGATIATGVSREASRRSLTLVWEPRTTLKD